jgi:hypothetical protein
MYFLPCPAEIGDVIQQFRLDAVQLAMRKTEIYPQTQWT